MPSAATIESLEIEITSKSTGVVSHLRSLAQALAEIKPSTAKNGLSSIATGITKINDALRSFEGFQKLVDLRDTLSQIRGVANQAKDALAGFNQEIKNAPNIRAYKDLANTIARMGGLDAFMNGGGGGASVPRQKTNSDPSMLPSTQVFSGMPSISDVETAEYSEILNKNALIVSSYRETLDKERVLIEAAYEEIADPVVETGKSITNAFQEIQTKAQETTQAVEEVAESVEEVGEAAEKTAKSKLSKFVDMLKRIVMYRAIRGVISAIGKAMEEGIKNAYEWSRLNDGQFAQSMDTLASCAVQLKNALGAIAVPIIQIVTPAIQAITKVIVDLANAISWLWSIITGAGTYMKVSTDYMTEFGKSAKTAGGAAGSAAKEMRTILGFDEINKLNGDNGGGGGGGGANGTDFGSMFSMEDNFANKLNEFREQIKAAIIDVSNLTDCWGMLDSQLASSAVPLKKTQTTLERLGEAAESVITKIIESHAKHNQAVIAWAFKVASSFDETRAKIEGWVTATSASLNAWSGKVYTNVSTSIRNMVVSIRDQLAQARETINSWATKASEAFEIARAAASNKMAQIGSAITNAKNNIVSWASVTAQRMNEWSGNVATNVGAFASSFVNNIYNALLSAGTNIMNWTKTTADSFRSWASNAYSSIATWASNMANKVAQGIKSAYDSIKSFLKATNSGSVGALAAGGAVAAGALALSGMKSGGSSSLGLTKNYTNVAMAYAQGGFPVPGDLFIANERGPELVGSMNNRPAVANQQQIIEGISQGVARAMMTQESLLREQNELLRSRGDVVVTTGSLVDSFSRMNRRSGTTVVPVGG